MFSNKYAFTFAFITFLLLSITGAGIFVDDEWVSAQQLRQLGEGHQIVFNEGAYGYYANGTSGTYFTFRENRLMYSMALPIISLPIYEILKFTEDLFRGIIIAFWTLLGIFICYYLYSIRKITEQYLKLGIGAMFILTLANIYLYKSFQIAGKFLPSEVLAIVTTNILLFGIFSVILHKIIDLFFEENNKLKTFSFISILSCTSIIFWAGTCKDHILSLLIATLILYYLLKYEKEESMTALSIGFFLIGLLTWIRIELGLGLLIGTGIYLTIYHYRKMIAHALMLLLSTLTGTIPLWINNYITTGSIFIHPFMVANAHFDKYYTPENAAAAAILIEQAKNPLWTTFHTLFAPTSGAIGFFIIIPLVVICIAAYLFKHVKLSQTEILLLFITFGSSIYYFFNIQFMHADTGIIPDMRYFIFFYMVITLFSISILTKIFPDLKHKKIIIYYILIVGLMIILFTTYAATISKNGTYRDLNRIINTLTTIVLGIGLIATINDIRLNKKYLTYILPILIAIPMAWQIVMLFIYHTSKAHAYPMFLPLTELIYNYVFGLII